MINYLGHIISVERVKANLAKIQSMLEWPLPMNTKVLRGFLGLTRYYRKFICNYGLIASPPTYILRKNAFEYNEKSAKALEELKRVVTQPLVLKLPKFSQPFTIERDASRRRVEAVQMQTRRPITFMIKLLKGMPFLLSTYEELMALVRAIQKWSPYIIGQSFVIKTD